MTICDGQTLLFPQLFYGNLELNESTPSHSDPQAATTVDRPRLVSLLIYSLTPLLRGRGTVASLWLGWSFLRRWTGPVHPGTEKVPQLQSDSQTRGEKDSRALEIYAERSRANPAGGGAMPLLAADFALLGEASRRAGRSQRPAWTWEVVLSCAKAQEIRPKRQVTGPWGGGA